MFATGAGAGSSPPEVGCCATECERHAGAHDHCRLCAQVCRACEQACRQLLAALG